MSLEADSTGPFLVPYASNPRFTGRERELTELHALVRSHAPVVARAALDMGPGGCGVTQLAVAYAHRYRSEYPDGVYWAGPAWDWWQRRAPGTSVAILAQRVGLTTAPMARPWMHETTAGLGFYLAQRPRSLLIVEDVDDPDAFSLPGPPASSELPRRVILLSRRRSTALRAAHLDVGLMDEPSALPLLRLDDSERARSLARALGCLPLALTIAGAHLGAHPDRSVDAYGVRLSELGVQPAPDGDLHAGLAARHRTATNGVLTVSWDTLDATARRVLALLALMGPGEHVPRRRFEMLAGEDAAALDGLVRAALVERLTEGAIRLHPEVRAFVSSVTADGDGLAIACLERLLAALSDPEQLEREVYERGAAEVAGDAYLGRTLCMHRADAQELDTAFWGLLRLFEEAGPPGWDQARIPGMMMQTFRRHFAHERPELAARAEERLAERKSPYLHEVMAASTAPGTTANTIVSVAVTADNRCAIAVARDGSISTWELPSGRALYTLQVAKELFLVPPELSGSALVCLWSPHLGGPLSLWDLTSGRVAMELDGIGQEQVRCLALSRHGHFAAAATNHGMLRVWDLVHPGAPHVTWFDANTFDHERRAVAITDDGRALILGTEDGRLIIERRTRERVTHEAAHVGPVSSVAVMPDDRRVMTGGNDGAIKLWDIDTAALLATFDEHPMEPPAHPWMLQSTEFPRAVSHVAPTEDGRFAVVVVESQWGHNPQSDNSITIWDLAAGRVVLKLPASRRSHLHRRRCAVSPDARTIVLSGGGNLGVVSWLRWNDA